MKVLIGFVLWLQDQRNAINAADLGDIDFMEDGEKVDIPKEKIKEWEFTGLNNTDFITSGFYKENE